MDLVTEIKGLIGLRQEGAYWDFKREWYGEKHKGDLLHDIICMANNLVNRDAYIIIGVDEEKDFSIRDVRDDSNRKNTQMMVTFLRDKKFAGDVRPIVQVECCEMETGMIDVIIVRNSTNTPFYLKDKFEKVRPNHIYTRIQDSNTSCDSSADIQNVEYLWKKRFGLILSPLERMQVYLQHPEDWEDIPSRGGTYAKYYRYSPEYTIERTSENRRNRDDYEFFSFAQMNRQTRSEKIRLHYNQTLLEEFGCVILDGGKYVTVSPEIDGFSQNRIDSWEVSFRFLVKGTLIYYLHELLYDRENEDARIANKKHMRCILLFESEEEHQEFITYAMARWPIKERYEQGVHLPYFPDITGLNMDYFMTAYLNSQILQKMLCEFREETP